MTATPLAVIGIGLDGPVGLGPEARACLAHAEVLAAARRHLEFFPDFSGERIVLEGDLPGWVEKLKSRDRHKMTVVLATGDPLFYGVGRLLLEAFPKEELLFLPHVSSIALAFARLKETWNDACVVSVHGRPLQMILPALDRREPKIAVFTDAGNHPAAIARMLCETGLGGLYVQWVCENLGGEDEKITRWSPEELTRLAGTSPSPPAPLPRRGEGGKAGDFAPLNVVVLLRDERRGTRDGQPKTADEPRDDNTSSSPRAPRPLPLVGLPESAFRHRGEPSGLITKREVRLQALCHLELHHGDVFWDVGAGSGSVSIEATRLSSTLRVYAIERASEARAYLKENLDNFGLANIRLVAGEAPESLADLPDPDAVFVGGNGGRLLDIISHVMQRLKPGGRLVLSCVALETLSQAWNWFSERRLDPQATSLQLAHSRPLLSPSPRGGEGGVRGPLHSLEPEKPIFLLRVTKP